MMASSPYAPRSQSVCPHIKYPFTRPEAADDDASMMPSQTGCASESYNNLVSFSTSFPLQRPVPCIPSNRSTKPSARLEREIRPPACSPQRTATPTKSCRIDGPLI